LLLPRAARANPADGAVGDYAGGDAGQDEEVRLVRRFALLLPEFIGAPATFLAAAAVVAAWIVWGIVARWSTAWLLWPSAVASVFTFLLVFSLQYTQNRDTRALQLKLDEILRATARARSELVKLEHRSDEELDELEREIIELRDEESGG
jgi:low affinity Fe/Cu permease